jgi:23S rRNA (adenine2503-C2)-methyltransferase
MTDLPIALRAQLQFIGSQEVRRLQSVDGLTSKLLLRLHDGQEIEAVEMNTAPEGGRKTICVSTQAGCAMGCVFCVTGQFGFARNLEAGEVLEQVLRFNAPARPVTNVVFMGMGEPLANYNRVLAAVRRIIAAPPNGFGISARSVTVSTVGLAPAIRKLADEGLGVTLALSLHAPDDELRDTLVPVNSRWKVSEALDAARYYADQTGRRVSIEYALIRDVNDQPWRADLLGKRLHGALGPLVHVNVIPLNPTPGSEWDASPKAAEREFVRRVRERGVSCTVRDTRGREIAAACGQLAAQS